MSDMTKSKYALETHSVVKQYQADTGTIFAVDNVSLQVEAGEFVALVGPSGSGKTTMLSMLAALLKPTSGQILLDGEDLAGMREPSGWSCAGRRSVSPSRPTTWCRT